MREGQLSVPEGLPVLLRDLIQEYTGIYFDAARFDIMLEKLGDLARALGHSSFMEYYYLLKYQDPNRVEWQKVIEALSVQETYFWREMSQINVLVQMLVPQWFNRRKDPLRIWSAACATGEEPYTIAMALSEAGWSEHPIEIFASDASESALQKGRQAVYRDRAFRATPHSIREKYFTPQGSTWLLSPDIAKRVRFYRANILERREILGLSSSPIVFCRNLFIYFSPDTIRRALYLFANSMPDDGCLFVGASESLLKLTDQFELEEIRDAFVYKRRRRTLPQRA